ncbi:porin family protein [uncultured Bacteroides sp.]|uniref:porin family protein n=1 Tax=uncultured Bacteroides sp. TaxID=162156 RepID=UPI002604AF34|nr:porin family protein [uncultured Bacteroides sp.]
MKKFLLVLVCAIVCTSIASAQYASDASSSFFSVQRSDEPVTFGIRGGVNFAKQTASSDGYSFSPKNNVGFNFGVSVDIPMMESLYLQSGLYYTVKGYKLEEDGYTEKATPSYLELPILASYRYNFSEYTQLQVNFGPYLAYGIAGKYKWDDGDDDEDYFNDDIKKFDAGLAIGAGMIFGHIFVGINYDLGLTNILKDSEGTLKNKCLSINVGYNF